MVKIWKNIQYLSLDVVGGAIISSLFIAEVLAVKMTVAIIIGLSIAIWLIYTADHLLDAKDIKGSATNPRHAFHQKYFKILSAITAIIFILGVINIFYLPKSTIKIGFLLILLVGLYFVSIRWIKIKFLWHKELSAAIIYSFGVFAGPISLVSSFHWISIYLFIQFFLIALLNLLLFPLYEVNSDQADNMPSIVLAKGEIQVRKTVQTLFLICLTLLISGVFFLSYFNALQSSWLIIQSIFLQMLMALGALYFWPDFFSRNRLYRTIGDGVFFIPLLFLL